MKHPSSPAWSIHGRYAEKTESTVPGPGNYDPKPRHGSPSIKFGSSTRDNLGQGITTPGPGSYSADKGSLTGSPIRFGTGKRADLGSPTASPGPGAYLINSLVGEGPHYSIKKRYGSSYKEDVPGPGAYDPKLSHHVYESSPQYRIGTANRSTDKRHDSPGPGAYDSKKRTDGPQWGFGGEPRDKMYGDNANPGPGSYELPSTRDRKAFSISSRHKESGQHLSPGPGAYSPSKSVDSPYYSMGKGGRDSWKETDAPGPGAYFVNGQYLGKSASTTSIRIGTGTRRPLSAGTENPGPGNYNVPARSIEGPQWSMRPRTANHKSSDAPGPGHYDQSMNRFTFDTVTGGKFGSSVRNSIDKSGHPVGPGAYDVNAGIDGPKWGFGSQSRDKFYGDKLTPGPGSYSVPDFKDKRGFSMSSRHPDKNRSTSPGPGAYSPLRGNDAPNFSIGKGARSSSIKHEVPGPGAYDSRPWSSNSVGSYKFGSGNRRPLSASQTVPGPGNYNPDTGPAGPSFTMRPKTAQHRSTDAPGPGHYDQSMNRFTHDTVTGGKFGSSKRGGLDKSGHPVGPGAYEIKTGIIGPKWGFGSQSRDKLYGEKSSPGPGAYSVPDYKDKRGFSMSSRYPSKSQFDVPGPGAYSPSKSRDAPNYSMGTGGRNSLGDKHSVPGPGAYDSRPWSAKQGSVKFGSSSRPQSSGNIGPGPGAYFSASKKYDGPSYSIRPKTSKDKPSEVPGPGHYDQSPTKVVHDSPLGGKFGSSSRASIDRNSNPVGPGMYDIRGTLGGQKWGFGTGSRHEKIKHHSPGPGHYDHKATIPNVPYYERV